ncbi:hypothetical protein D3C79_506630 [compost metagenome]
MIGIVVVCIDIAILVALFSLPPLLWLFGGHLIELEVKWRHHCRAKRRSRAAAARLKAGN